MDKIITSNTKKHASPPRRPTTTLPAIQGTGSPGKLSGTGYYGRSGLPDETIRGTLSSGEWGDETEWVLLVTTTIPKTEYL